MGREIRRVPKGWAHPRAEDGNFKPLYDETYQTAAEQWVTGFLSWKDGTHPDCSDENADFYWDWEGDPPNKDCYRPEFTSDPICFQVYETVSEGTPTSPVFADEAAMVVWLIGQGHSREAAEGFVSIGSCPSFMIYDSGKMVRGIDACAIGREKGA